MLSQQLQLWEPLQLAIECDGVIPSNTVALETLNDERLKQLPKGKYKIHSDGGWHYFKDVPGAEYIFTKQIWPWVEVYMEKFDKTYVLQPAIMEIKGFYSQVTLYISQTANIKINFHQLVAMAFVPNTEPDKKTIVDHINGWKVDYRIENLRWLTPSENSTGPKLDSRLSPDIVYKMWKDSVRNEK
jgi:hypothetical protein